LNKSLSLKYPLWLSVILILSILFSGCNAFKKSEGSQPDYKELKQMVIDILQTEDGKKAIKETLQDEEMKKKLVLETGDVEKIVQDEVLSPENMDKLKKMFEDPKFASELGKSLKKENEQILKDLMKDPTYREMLIDVMKDKEYEKIVMDIMKSNEYRNQMMMVIKDSLESPMFKYDLLKLMEEASKKALEPEKKEEDKEAKKEEDK